MEPRQGAKQSARGMLPEAQGNCTISTAPSAHPHISEGEKTSCSSVPQHIETFWMPSDKREAAFGSSAPQAL